MFTRYQYLIFQIVAHAATVAAFFLLDPLWWLLVPVFYWTNVGLGISLMFHRVCTHRAATLSRWARSIGLALGTIAGQGSSVGWVAKHTQHHRHSDTAQDPHSPQHNNPWILYWTNLIHGYSVHPKYAARALKDRDQVWFHKWYWLVHAVYATVLATIAWELLFVAWLVPAALGWLGTGFGVAIASHQWGDQPHPSTQDNSRNNAWVSWLVFGEGWQNSHHQQPIASPLGPGDSVDWVLQAIKNQSTRQQ